MTRTPVISEATAKRQLAAARAQVTLCTRALNALPTGPPPGATRDLRDSWLARLERSERNLDAAEARLGAIQSQDRNRWREHADVPWTPEEDAAFGELGL